MHTGQVFLCVCTGRERKENAAINLTEQAWSIKDLWYGKTRVFFCFLLLLLLLLFLRRKQYGENEGVRQGSLQLVWTTKEQNITLPANRVFLSLAGVWCTRERLCMNRVKFFLNMHSMLLGYSFETRPDSRALATAGSVMTIGLSTNRCLHSKKPVWREKTRLTSRRVWRRRPQRFDVKPPFLLLTQEHNRRLCSQRGKTSTSSW